MADITLLREKIDERGIKLGFVASKMGISRQSLYRKLIGERPFSLNEAQSICAVLGLEDADRDRIFFAD